MSDESKGTKDAARRGGPALESAYQLLLWLTPTVEKYPRNFKFTLGDRTMATAIEALDHLIVATYSRDRLARLSAANLALERLRLPIS